MNRISFFTCIAALGAAIPAVAHGPQLQITVDQGKITTREIRADEPYSTVLTPQKSAYVMPLSPTQIASGTVWYSRPNPAFPSGPGFAYGYDMQDGVGPQTFEAASILSYGITDEFKRWNGAAFINAGATELKAFTGSNPETATNFAVTTDIGPFPSLAVTTSGIAANYNGNAHNSARFAMLGDGSSVTSPVADGVYLLSMQVTSTQSSLSSSDTFYFVLNKNAPWQTLLSAVSSLPVAPSQVQWVVPEPTGVAGLVFLGFMAVAARRRASERGGN